MADQRAELKHRPYSKWRFALPFGHYEASGEQEPPADEVLIGREGQRAYLIDLLLNMGRRGAYLVTGRRGAGKTSFVRHCISEYRAEVFGRFVRSPVGRTLLWDKTLVWCLALGAMLSLVFLSEVMALILHGLQVARSDEASPEMISHHALFSWLVIAPLALICAYPLLYAKEVLEVVVAAFRQETSREDQWNRIGALLSLSVFVLFAWWCDWRTPSGGLTLSRLFATICLIYLMVNLISFRSLSTIEGSQAKEARWRTYRRVVLRVLLMVGPATAFWFPTFPLSSMDHTARTWYPLASGLMFFSAGAVIRFLLLRTIMPGDSASADAVREPERTRRARRESASWYIVLALFPFALALAILLAGPFSIQAVAVAALPPMVVVPLGTWLRRRGAGSSLVFEPRPLYALTAKAAVAVVVGFQLLHPLIYSWQYDSIQERAPLRSSTPFLHPVQPSTHLLASTPAAPPLGPHQRQAILGVFGGQRYELTWVLELMMLLSVVYFLEYEWIVRPFVALRIDRSFTPETPAPWADRWRHGEGGDRRRTLRELASMSLPWLLYDTWLPVFVLSVNLGFDDLDHRRVVHAMLVSLRSAYHRTFLAWNSGLANIGRCVKMLPLIVVALLAGDRLFGIRPTHLGSAQLEALSRQAPEDYPEPCEALAGRQAGPGIVNLVCQAPGGSLLFHLLYFDLLGNRGIEKKSPENLLQGHLLLTLLPNQDEDVPPDAVPPLLSRGLHFRVYHVLTIAMFWLASHWLFHRLPILPYQEALNRLDATLDNLSSRTRTSSKKTSWKLPRWLQGHFADESVRESLQEPHDPRTLEVAFLSILQDIQAACIRLPGAKNQLVSLPAPEITYVFDELDKLGMRPGTGEGGAEGSSQEAAILDAERRRSLELHKLLAKMKNLLSSAPSRFIFVGGRDMHDEWLADQTARHPQLTNIFNAEIYLPSLVTDHTLPPPVRDGRTQPARLHHRIEEFLLCQERRAQILYCRWAKNHWLPSSALPLRDLLPESFVPLHASMNPEDADPMRRAPIPLPPLQTLAGLEIQVCHKSDPRLIADDLSTSLLCDFVYFMAYRSMGNPKKLKELLASFVRPVGRMVDAEKRWQPEFDCRHVLQFGDLERFRIQLLADIYRHLTLAEEERLVYRDDKIAISVFYLADFLFKFHRRAFSWSNLERVDELIHIHHAPDLREVLDEIIARWSERLLHPIRNGMYTFRFRSDIASEVEYLSRQSPYEMAAFNFTLDESQALKARYESAIQKLESKHGLNLQDLVAGLGELHEFDEEYETARLHYRRALHHVDDELIQILAPALGQATPPPIAEILRASPEGLADIRLYLTWGIARLRLMLQIGLTFEHVQNLERAAVEYRDARTLARSLILAMLGETHQWEEASEPSDKPRDRRMHVLKNLNLAFQPTFAEAWVAEKLTGGVDTSVALVERELMAYRRLLPFVRDPVIRLSTNPGNVRASNFALIVAELHNKAGDLYFFKGRQLVSNGGSVSPKPQQLLHDSGEGSAEPRPTNLRKGPEGYLLRAHYHYAVALHELARFVTHRRHSSRFKFNIWSETAVGRWDTISSLGWPDFVFRAVGGTINDLAESMLGRVSLFNLFAQLAEPQLLSALPSATDESADLETDLLNAFDEWLEAREVLQEDSSATSPEPEKAEDLEISLPIDGYFLAAGTLSSWLGDWRGAAADDKELLRFNLPDGHGDAQRLLVALHFTLVGAKYLERGGYLEDAATELMTVCETVTQFLWWGLQQRRLADLFEERSLPFTTRWLHITPNALLHPYWRYAIHLACKALRKADQLFRRTRHAEPEEKTNIVGDKIPPGLLTTACSLALATHNLRDLDPSFSCEEESGASPGAEVSDLGVVQVLVTLIESWTGKKRDTGSLSPWIEMLLKRCLIRYAYPMLNRLHALRLLIESTFVSAKKETWAEGEALLLAQAEELLALAEQFAAPLHFTPMNPGVSCALVYLRCRIEAGEDCSTLPAAVPRERLRQAALRTLTMSEEMHTMRRAYYEAISGLYYLYDDFNDRQIHSRAALQMAGTEVVGLLKMLLEWPEKAAETTHT